MKLKSKETVTAIEITLETPKEIAVFEEILDNFCPHIPARHWSARQLIFALKCNINRVREGD